MKVRTIRSGADRGAIPLIPLIIAAIFVGAAATTSVVILKQNQGNNSGGFSLKVESGIAQRDDSDQPKFLIQYEVDLKSDGAAAALQSTLLVRCTVKQEQLTQDRTFGGEAFVVVNTRFAKGTVAIAPNEAHAIQGAYDVTCQLLRDNAVLDTAEGPSIVVGPPKTDAPTTPTSTSAALPVTDLAGTYAAIFDRADGNTIDCVPTESRSVIVTATSPTTIKVELDGFAIYEGGLTSDLLFTGSAGLYPGHPDYFGVLKGQFFREAQIDLAMSLDTTDPKCAFSFSAHKN